MLHQSGGYNAEFNTAVEIYSMQTDLCYGNQVDVFEQKIGCSSAV